MYACVGSWVQLGNFPCEELAQSPLITAPFHTLVWCSTPPPIHTAPGICLLMIVSPATVRGTQQTLRGGHRLHMLRPLHMWRCSWVFPPSHGSPDASQEPSARFPSRSTGWRLKQVDMYASPSVQSWWFVPHLSVSLFLFPQSFLLVSYFHGNGWVLSLPFSKSSKLWPWWPLNFKHVIGVCW